MKSESEKAAVCAMFDAFCKEVLRNAVKDYKKKLRFVEKNEFVTADPEKYISADCSAEDHYASDHIYITYRGYDYPLDNDILRKGLERLPPSQLGVLLLTFWRGLKDAQIAEQFGVTTRTVRNRRSRALTNLRRWYKSADSGVDIPSEQS